MARLRPRRWAAKPQRRFRGQRGAPLRYQRFRGAIWDRAVAEPSSPTGSHRDVTTTMNVYAGLFPNRLEEIAAALDGLYQAAQ